MNKPKGPVRPSPITWRPQTLAQVTQWKEIGGAKWLRRVLDEMRTK